MAGNGALIALMEQAGLSRRELARWVNVMAERRGLHLGCSHTSVARWLEGAQPRRPIPELIAEALGRHLGCELTVADLGLRDRRPPTPDPFDGLIVARTAAEVRTAVAELSERDMNRRSFLANTSFGVGAFAAPTLYWSTASHAESEPEPLASNGPTTVREADVQRIHQTVVAFRRLDRAQGGGDLRDTVVHHLNGVARTKLAGSYGDQVGRGLFRAVAELTELAGWLSFDSGRHALAQRYHIQALRLAQAAHDPAYGAYVLANMACQAVYLGHGWEAVQLARAADQGAGHVLDPRARAIVAAMEARGHAAMGDRRACEKSMGIAERHLDAAGPAAEDPSWCNYFDESELRHEFAHSHRDLGLHERTHEYAAESLKLRREGASRRCAQDTTFMAAAHLAQGDLDAACDKATDALRIAGSLSSAQCDDFLADFRNRLRPHAHEPVARAFTEEANQIMGTPAAA